MLAEMKVNICVDETEQDKAFAQYYIQETLAELFHI